VHAQELSVSSLKVCTSGYGDTDSRVWYGFSVGIRAGR
jgi:hypothetical protein